MTKLFDWVSKLLLAGCIFAAGALAGQQYTMWRDREVRIAIDRQADRLENMQEVVNRLVLKEKKKGKR